MPDFIKQFFEESRWTKRGNSRSCTDDDEPLSRGSAKLQCQERKYMESIAQTPQILGNLERYGHKIWPLSCYCRTYS